MLEEIGLSCKKLRRVKNQHELKESEVRDEEGNTSCPSMQWRQDSWCEIQLVDANTYTELGFSSPVPHQQSPESDADPWVPVSARAGSLSGLCWWHLHWQGTRFTWRQLNWDVSTHKLNPHLTSELLKVNLIYIKGTKALPTNFRIFRVVHNLSLEANQAKVLHKEGKST